MQRQSVLWLTRSRSTQHGTISALLPWIRTGYISRLNDRRPKLLILKLQPPFLSFLDNFLVYHSRRLDWCDQYVQERLQSRFRSDILPSLYHCLLLFRVEPYNCCYAPEVRRGGWCLRFLTRPRTGRIWLRNWSSISFHRVFNRSGQFAD